MSAHPLVKISAFLTLLLILSSFSIGKVQVPLNADRVETASWIDTVILHSQSRVDGSHIDVSNDVFFLDDIDSSFFKRHLNGFETGSPQNWILEFDPFSRYYFFDYQLFDSWVSFTIMHNTEYGYTNFYTFSFDRKLNKITSVMCISQHGADGGAWNDDHFFYSDSGRKLTVRSQSYYDQDIDYDGGLDHCYTRTFDSIASDFHFFRERTEFSIDTIVSKLDTICV